MCFSVHINSTLPQLVTRDFNFFHESCVCLRDLIECEKGVAELC